ncbi:MAG: sugar phosphate isomerase/epimerase [Desulfofustis sp.]|nr:sugar phosphate isomerase/epimerase [Desulfofustis sp.]
MLKLAIITSFLSQTKDRFHEYNKPLNLDEKFALLSGIEGYNGVEIVYPYEVNDSAQTRAALQKFDLNVAAVNVNVKAEPEFRNGGVTALEQAVREKAVQFIKNAKDFAADIGADKVTCCPLGDAMNLHFKTTTHWPGST